METGDVMKEIGELLKTQRLAKGLTIEEVSQVTKLSIAHIKAIESGDMSYFKDDLSYLRFFLRSYCKCVGSDYEDIKQRMDDSVVEFTTSYQVKEIKEHQEMEKNIQMRAKKTSERFKETEKNNPSQSLRDKVNRKTRNIDFSLVSFLSIVSVVVLCVLVVAGIYLVKNMNKEPVDVPPVVDKPDIPVTPDPEPEEDPVEPEVKEMVVSRVDASHYLIENATEKVDITIEFVPSSWFLATMDNVDLTKPASKIYNAGEVLTISMDPEKNTELKLRFGYFAGMRLKVNDQYVEVDDSIKNLPNSINIFFTIGGSEDEPAQ